MSALPFLAHLRHGAMRNCSLRPVKSSYSVVRVWKDYFLWTQYKYKQESTILLDDMFRTKSYDLSYHCQYKKSRAAAPYCGNYLFQTPVYFSINDIYIISSQFPGNPICDNEISSPYSSINALNSVIILLSHSFLSGYKNLSVNICENNFRLVLNDTFFGILGNAGNDQ